jgi:hypothetical protein
MDNGMISSSTALTLITGGFTDFGTAVLAILGLVLGIGVGYLIFKWGWNKIVILSQGEEVIGSFGDIGIKNRFTGKVRWMDEETGGGL